MRSDSSIEQLGDGGKNEQPLGASNGSAAFLLREHRAGDMGWIVHRHGVLYAQEHGWNIRFEALVARIAADFIDNFLSGKERCWIAERDGVFLGCVLLVRNPAEEGCAKLRLLLVEPDARGLGVGRTLVHACTLFARQVGYRKITLWTNPVLTAAIRLYENEGYKVVREGVPATFGKKSEPTWEMELELGPLMDVESIK